MNKSEILNIVDKMPDEISASYFIAELFFTEKLEIGIKQIEEGKLLSHFEAKNRLSKWLK